jgi:DNA cross-link repair 1C protein
VSLFRPRRVVPNTTIPGLHGLDWLCMEQMFEHCLCPHDRPSTAVVDARSLRADSTNLLKEDAGDTSVQNLVGNCEAIEERWTQDGRLRKKLDMLRGYLSGEERALVDVILNRGKAPAAQTGSSPGGPGGRRGYEESDDDTNYGSLADDERGRTAHALFAGLAGLEESQAEQAASGLGRNSLLINSQQLIISPPPSERNNLTFLQIRTRNSSTPTPTPTPTGKQASPATPTAHLTDAIQPLHISVSSSATKQRSTPPSPASARHVSSSLTRRSSQATHRRRYHHTFPCFLFPTHGCPQLCR